MLSQYFKTGNTSLRILDTVTGNIMVKCTAQIHSRKKIRLPITFHVKRYVQYFLLI